MIDLIDCSATARTPIAEGNVRTVLGAPEGPTRVSVSLIELDQDRTMRFGPSERTEVAYLLEGDAEVSHTTIGGEVAVHDARRRTGIYLEPGEEASVQTRSPVVLLHVTVPKHRDKEARSASPTGYFFDESQLQSLVDEKGIRERTFWVNTETGLSDSWDLQLGRMQYAPQGHSPRHVHRPSDGSATTPEHFYLIESGTGTVEHDGGTLQVGPGTLVLIPSGEWHRLVASDSGLDYIEFQAPFDFATTMDHDPLGKNWYIKGTDDGTGKPQLWVQS